MSEISLVQCSNRKLNQTKISEYFTGCSRLPTSNSDKKLNQRKSVRRTRKGLFSCASRSETMADSSNTSWSMDSVLSSIEKRKLPAPIFSEDEDSENDCSKSLKSLGVSPNKQPRILLSLNRPGPVSPEKIGTIRTMFSTSSPTPLNKTLSNENLTLTSALSTPKTETKSKRKPKPKTNSVRKSSKLLNKTLSDDNLTSASALSTPNTKTGSKRKVKPKDKPANNSSTLLTKTLSSENLASTPNTKTETKQKLKPKDNLVENSSTLSNKTLSNENLALTSALSTPNIKTGSKRKLEPEDDAAKEPKNIKVLQNVVVTPKKSPQKESVKDETKKINYEQLKVMREFFTNILKSNHLISLFTASDKELLTKFFDIEKTYQYVCIKLFLWKPIWYNIFKFVEKIGLSMKDCEINEMYNHLKDSGFVETEYMVEDTFTLLDLLHIKDVRDIGRNFRLTNLAGTKDTVIAKLLKHSKTQITLTSQMNSEEVLRTRIKEKMGFCIKLSTRLSHCLYCVYLLNTFANFTLTDPQDYFTTVRYFNTVFPTYNIENFHVFYTPLEFSRYAEAVRLGNNLDKAIEKKNNTQIFEICRCAYEALKEFNEEFEDSFDNSREPHLERFTPNAQYAKIISTGSPHITASHSDQIVEWFEYLLSQGYCKHKRGQWYCQLLLIHTFHKKNYETAAKLLIKGLKEEKANFTDIQLQELAHRGKMLNKKTYNLPQLFHDEITALSEPLCDRDWPRDIIDCQSIASEEPRRRRTYPVQGPDGAVHYLNVEQLALQHYQSVGYPNGDHCEGRLIIASFCLLFWDIIYETYVKGTFILNVQNAPLDMYSKYFYINRQEKITKRLKNIKQAWKDEVLKKKLHENWRLHSHEGSLCQIDSAVDSVDILYDVIQCIGRPIVAKIFERLVKNFRLYHSGFPDLIVWNTQEKKAKIVEVKSEKDTLSIKQKLWLNYLMDIGASVAVCHVEPKASKKKLVKKQATTIQASPIF